MTDSPLMVFVYGTLRRGCSRDLARRFSAARMLGRATVVGYLFDLRQPRDRYPGLRLDATGGPVVGEVLAIDEAILQALDAIEGCRPDRESSLFWRSRTTATFTTSDQEPAVACWVYEYNPRWHPQARPIPGGDWVEYLQAEGLLDEPRDE